MAWWRKVEKPVWEPMIAAIIDAMWRHYRPQLFFKAWCRRVTIAGNIPSWFIPAGIQCAIFSRDQAALWMVRSVGTSVCPSVRPPVCDTFFTMFQSMYHHEIFRSYYNWQKWCPCKRSRSKVKVTEVKTQFSRFRTTTPVWIYISLS